MEEMRRMKRLNDRGGVNRATGILLALIAVMLVVIAIPAWRVFSYRSAKTGCVQAMKSATDGLIIEYLYRRDSGSEQDARDALDSIMVARPDICPAGGNVYLIRGANDIYVPVCGLHDDDAKLRVRLNASYAMDALKEARRIARRDTGAEPESVEITVNSKPLECVRVQAEEDIHRGTATTNGYKGIVCFYGLAGEGSFTSYKDVAAGDICYFVYADENHCAIWRSDDGWTGDAYSEVEASNRFNTIQHAD